MSRFNTLRLGAASDAADALDSHPEAPPDEIRVALVNALNRIATLEEQVATLQGTVAGIDKAVTSHLTDIV